MFSIIMLACIVNSTGQLKDRQQALVTNLPSDKTKLGKPNYMYGAVPKECSESAGEVLEMTALFHKSHEM